MVDIVSANVDSIVDMMVVVAVKEISAEMGWISVDVGRAAVVVAASGEYVGMADIDVVSGALDVV